MLVHSSLRRIRPDQGGAATVVCALLDVLGDEGTLVVPTQTAWNSTTSRHYLDATAGLTPQEIVAYRDAMPAFDPLTTPSSGMGAIAEYVRTMPDAHRSTHPHTSFAAVGALAKELTACHEPECHLGERSPLGELYLSDGWILHLGTGYQTATIFHLAEYRYTQLATRVYEAHIVNEQTGHNVWTAFEDIPLDDDDFARLGANFESHVGTPPIRHGRVGNAAATLYPARAAVDYAVEWMRRERRTAEPKRTNQDINTRRARCT